MIYYAVNERTKKHVRISNPDAAVGVSSARGVNDGDLWRIVEADDDGWIPWRGETDEGPLPDRSSFDYMVRSGEVVEGKWASYWAHTGTASDIIAYRPILDYPSETEAAGWDGVDLPPIGCECEFASVCDTGDDDESATWELAKVIGYDGSAAVVSIDGGGYAGSACCADFRPIRSDEDRAVRSMLADMSIESLPLSPSGELTPAACRQLYRAGYRKS